MSFSAQPIQPDDSPTVRGGEPDGDIPITNVSPELREQRAAEADYAATMVDLSKIKAVRARIERVRDVHLDISARTVREHSHARMDDRTWRDFQGRTKAAAELEQRATALRALETDYEQRAGSARVVAEPRVYGDPESGNSYFLDLVAFSDRQHPDYGGAVQRMSRYCSEVAYEVRRGSTEGRRAERAIREMVRDRDVALHRRRFEEERALTTGGGTTASGTTGAAAFVTPAIYVAEFAPFRFAGRVFSDQCRNLDLAPYGMQAYIPHFASAVGEAAQTEGSGITETDPSAGLLSGAVEMIAGTVTISQQLLDRSRGGDYGMAFDAVLYEQLRLAYDSQIDQFALSQALANAGSVTYTSGSFAVATASAEGGFIGRVSAAKSAVRKTAGTVLNPTHLFLQSDRWELISGSADANGRPLVLPDYVGLEARNGDSNFPDGYTGYTFNGLPVFVDINIPAPGTGNDQAIVASPSQSVYVFESPEPVARVLPQTDAATLQVPVQLYGYAAAIERFPSGIQAISGTGMAAITL